MKVEICFGSSCHTKGAADLYERLLKALRDDGLDDKVEVDGTLCLGHCKEKGVNVRVDDEVILGITADNFTGFYERRIKKPLLG